jgi:hypothetical protein
MAVGWLHNIANAETYFLKERLYYSFWTGLSTNTKKEASLIHAYNRLYYGNEFALPTYAEASADQLVVLRKANCEMAYYIAQHLADEDRRKNIQAQGVIRAGIVKETYLEEMMKNTPVPPFVRDMLIAAGFKKTKLFKVVALERDENKDLRK